MNALTCATCGGTEITTGEAGAPSHCANCDGVNFMRVRTTEHFKILEQHSPLQTTLKVIKRAECDPAKARSLFDKMHAVVDAA